LGLCRRQLDREKVIKELTETDGESYFLPLTSSKNGESQTFAKTFKTTFFLGEVKLPRDSAKVSP
jgi:hypothetical protein